MEKVLKAYINQTYKTVIVNSWYCPKSVLSVSQVIEMNEMVAIL